MSFNVLICDDSALARNMAKRSLPDGLAQQVQLAEHGQQAIDLLRSQPFDLLLLDLTMPIVDGIGVLETIKAERIEVFVVVVSGDVQPQMQAKALELGALDFIPKPVDAQALSAVLSRYGLY